MIPILKPCLKDIVENEIKKQRLKDNYAINNTAILKAFLGLFGTHLSSAATLLLKTYRYKTARVQLLIGLKWPLPVKVFGL